MTTTSAERIILRSPAALCCAVPHLLGFHPQDSAVLVWLADGSIQLTQRLDLPAAHVDLEGWTRAVWAHRGVDVADEVIVVLCADPLIDVPGEGLGALARAVRQQAERSSTAVRDVILLRGDRWRSQLCTDRECCPPEGRQIPEDLRSTVAGHFASDWVQPLPSRADVVASLSQDSDAAAAVASTGVLRRGRVADPAARERWRENALSNVRAWTASGLSEATAHRTAHLLLALRDVRVRDTLLWHLTRMESTELRTAQGQLCRLLRQAPAHETAPVATVAGVALWLLGDGVRAAAACDRALADDPHYTLALMLSVALGTGRPPAEWRAAMSTLSLHACRYGEDLQHDGQTL